MLILYPNDFTEAIIPIIHGSHQHWNKTSPPGRCPYSKKETCILSELIYIEFRLRAFALLLETLLVAHFISQPQELPIKQNFQAPAFDSGDNVSSNGKKWVKP